jgi:poly(3-hydroxybutyrate) depolymerase
MGVGEIMTARKVTWLGAVLALVLAAAACRDKPAGDAFTHSSEPWCPEGFEVGPQDTCFAIPDDAGPGTPVLVYLHGMYEGHGSAEEWSLVRSATDRGFAVIMPRGRRGLCAYKAELKDHFCWPQEPEDPEAFKSLVREWNRVLWQVDALMDGGTHKRYVLGFSEGGYFASFLATQGIFRAEAFAIVNGGRLAPKPTTGAVPVALIAAQADAEQRPKMKELHETLARAGWPHAYCARPGGDALSEADLEAALGFFRRDLEGTLRTKNGAYPCDPPAKPALPSPPAGGGDAGARPAAVDAGASGGTGGGGGGGSAADAGIAPFQP